MPEAAAVGVAQKPGQLHKNVTFFVFIGQSRGTPPPWCEGQGDGDGVVFSLDVGLSPFVAFLPAASRPGQTVGIFGQGFVGATAVDFDGTPAQFTVLSDTYLTTPVPAGAGTGFITVTTPSGTLTSNKKFQVRPVITSFSPSSGPVGTKVVIKGVSLGQTSKVTFDEAQALSFTVDSDTQVTAFVPTDAVTGKVGITTTGRRPTAPRISRSGSEAAASRVASATPVPSARVHVTKSSHFTQDPCSSV